MIRFVGKLGETIFQGIYALKVIWFESFLLLVTSAISTTERSWPN